jgi:hypothetical protein
MDHGDDVQGAGKYEIVHRLLLRTWQNFFQNRTHGRETGGLSHDADEVQPVVVGRGVEEATPLASLGICGRLRRLACLFDGGARIESGCAPIDGEGGLAGGAMR